MKHIALIACIGLWGANVALADDPPEQEPRTHVDTTVVGSAAAETGETEAATLDNDHHFEAGEPGLVDITNRLNLSARQKSEVNAAIERADAGAAALIKREHDVQDMISATTPQDPMYAKLIADQSAGAARWTENRERLRREVLDVLTPAQRTRFEELQVQR